MSVGLPAAFRHLIIAPKSEELYAPDGGGEVLVTEKATDNGYDITYELEASPAIVDPKDYAALLNMESALGQRSSKAFLLEKD
jgi:hypothetical protein